MPDKKILYVTTEMFPYQEESAMSDAVNRMALKMYGDGNDVRVFMPRFGYISERKFQLHEVIRLSGMNIIINDLDQPLIIKVASLPGERLQVYFIDNEDYFKRKFTYKDEEGLPFDDNDERAMFFARGVIETIKKLNWVPDVVHLNGWMSAFIPVYLKHYYKKDSYFDDTKFVLSVYNEENLVFDKKAVVNKFKFDNIKGIKAFDNPSFYSFLEEGMNLVDVVVKGDEFLEQDLDESFSQACSDKKEYVTPESVGEIY
ncbi:starch synthase [Riemerella anatipestifer]|uniref:glycogen/starch synthase n=1 Tax=Riemerella anatipestifer TaxID=34085 RepID=UPI000D13F9B8|nr:glycogen/starch synthase [Riemerella anatipestifer]MDD1524942.1 starch synthase [Riemerella anatipestifer]MDY3337870.1 glycogen/starch synthase [Riemerella anatipestifer]PST44464.1 starch synthase [Riemerella anatipestifer]